MNFNKEEKQYKRVSVNNMIKKYNLSYILCNDIINVGDFISINEVHDPDEYVKYYQYFIVEENDIEYWDIMGYQIFYHTTLNVFFIGVHHFGMSWDDILTDIPLINTDSELAIDTNYIFENLNYSLAMDVV